MVVFVIRICVVVLYACPGCWHFYGIFIYLFICLFQFNLLFLIRIIEKVYKYLSSYSPDGDRRNDKSRRHRGKTAAVNSAEGRIK